MMLGNAPLVSAHSIARRRTCGAGASSPLSSGTANSSRRDDGATAVVVRHRVRARHDDVDDPAGDFVAVAVVVQGLALAYLNPVADSFRFLGRQFAEVAVLTVDHIERLAAVDM